MFQIINYCFYCILVFILIIKYKVTNKVPIPENVNITLELKLYQISPAIELANIVHMLWKLENVPIADATSH